MTPAAAMLLATGITTGAGVTEATVSGARSKRAQERQMAYNAQQAQIGHERQANWVKEYETTKYEREMESLRRAGLNPMMVYGGGSNLGSAPNIGSAAQVGSAPSADFSGISRGAGSAVEAGLMMKRLRKDLEVADAQKQLLKAQAMKEKSQEALNYMIKNIKEFDLQQFEEFGLPSNQSVPMIQKWLNFWTKPTGGKKGMKLISNKGKQYDLNDANQRKAFLNSLKGDKEKYNLWKNALEKKYGGE